MTYYLTDGAHVLISGATGAGDDYGGKSVLANWWFQNSVKKGWHDVGLFYNPKGLGYVERGDDVRRVRTLQGLAKSYRAGYRLFDFYPSDGGSEASHEPVMEFLRNLPGKKIVVHDEVQSYADSEGVEWCHSMGGNMGQSSEPTGDVRSLFVTQRAWNLPEDVRSNCPLKIWVGPWGNEAENWVQAEKMKQAGEKIKESTGPYHWSVTDGGDYVETNLPVPEGYA